MRRMLWSVFLAAALLTGCGGRETPASPDEAPEAALTEQDVINMYTAASAVYDWFDLTTLPLDMEDARTEGGLTYYRVDAEDLSLPVSAVAEPTDSTLPWTPQPVTIASLADLRAAAETYFSPEMADSLFALSPDHYKDFDGVLYATDGGRGSNVYLLDKTAAAEQADEDHWTVTVTFYADSWAFEKPSTTVGYSQAVLDLEHTADGWKFTSFAPSDGLDLEAETVFQFTYDMDTFMRDDAGNLDTWSDLKLACWLLHADGAYTDGAADYFTRRFLADPNTWFEELSVFPNSPWEHADFVMESPATLTYAWYGQEEQDRLTEILDTYAPRNEQEQSLLDTLRSAQEGSIERATENATAPFCLVTEGQFLSLGRKEGGYPWDYEGLPETPQSAGTGDNGESLFTFSFGGVDVAYLDADGTDNIYRMTTTVPGPRTLGGIQVGDPEDDVKAVYTGAVQMEAVGEDQFGADYALIHEPGGLSYCKHISFFITDGVVSAIQVEDLVDGRLLS